MGQKGISGGLGRRLEEGWCRQWEWPCRSPEGACALGLTLLFSQAPRAMTTSWAEPPAPSWCLPLSSKVKFLQPWNMGIVLIPHYRCGHGG